MKRIRTRQGGITLAIFAVAVGLYANSWDNGFTLDDRSIVESNPLIRGIDKIPELFTRDYWEPELLSGLYRPLITSSYALNFEAHGLHPNGYHVVNIILHGIVSVLVWLLARRVVPDLWIAGAAGFLFAAHAIHTEAVANVVGRAELLATLFFLASLLSYLRAAESSGRPARLAYGGSLLSLFAGLLCKESAVTVLGVIGLYDVLFRTSASQKLPQRIGRALAEHGPRYAGYLVVVGLYLGVRTLALGLDRPLPIQIHLDNPLVVQDQPWRLLSALKVGLHYLWLLLFPLRLSYDYSYNAIPRIESLADPIAWAVLAAWGVIAGLSIWSYRAWPQLFFALGFYFVTFSVVSNVFVPIGTIMGERLAYLPSVGFCLAAAIVVRRALETRLAPPRALQGFVAVFVVAVGLHGVRTVLRNPVWTHSRVLFLNDWKVVPNSSKAMNNAAAMYFGKGDYEKAIAFFQRAIEIEPHYWMPYRTAAFTYTAMGKDLEAMEMYDLALRYGAAEPGVFNNLGFLLIDHEIDIDRGVELLEKAVELRPKNYEFLDSLGWGYFKQGRLEEARDTLRRSLSLNDQSPSTESRRAHLRTVEEALLERRGRERATRDAPGQP